MNQSVNIAKGRNDALDVLRALALCLMASIHLLREFLNEYSSVWVWGVKFILESAPVFFFAAFGMTVLHSTGGSNRWRRLFELGIISLLHQGYMDSLYPFKFDFLFFLWFMYLIVILFRRLFSNRLFRFASLIAILIVNLLTSHEKIGVFGAHPFGPLPWAFCVIVGMSVGLENQNKGQRIRLSKIGLALIIVACLIRWLGAYLNFSPVLTSFTKWHPTTSTYLLLWNGIVLCIYSFAGYINFARESIITKFIKILSMYLLQGTIVHYFTNLYFLRIFFQGGYHQHNHPPIIIIIVSIISVTVAVFFAILIMLDLKRVINNYVGGKIGYLIGWIVAIFAFMVVIVLSVTESNFSLGSIFSGFGMLIAALTFIDIRKYKI